MAITYTKKQKDKYGNIWLRDNYGGWTNEFGIRFTKTEHKRFGYIIRKANKEINEYMSKYPLTSALKSTDIGNRYRSSDLARFRRKSSYTNYLNVTKRIISGEQLYVRQPKNYQKNFLKALKRNEILRLASNDNNLKLILDELINKLKNLTNEQLIKLSRQPATPDINAYYTLIYDVQKSNIERLLEIINNL